LSYTRVTYFLVHLLLESKSSQSSYPCSRAYSSFFIRRYSFTLSGSLISSESLKPNDFAHSSSHQL